MKGAYIQMADRFYELHVAGVTRKLPILNVNDKLAIAGFVILGDVELVEKAAAALVKRVPPETEIMVTAETKGIPLVHEMAPHGDAALCHCPKVRQGLHGKSNYC